MTYKKEPGVYRWFISEEGLKKLWILPKHCANFDGKYLVYIGIAKNMNERINWHKKPIKRSSIIKKDNTPINSPTVSSLQWTIAALLDILPIPSNNDIIQEFMSKYMSVDVVEYTNNRKEAEEIENKLIIEYTPVLNTKGNKNNPYKRELREAKWGLKDKCVEALLS